MRKMVFEWRRSGGGGVNLAGHDPQVVGDELERLKQANGGKLFPSDVVEAAHSETSPLHAFFEWDDSDAARKYRLAQARSVLKVTVISKVGSRQLAEPVSQFVNVSKRDISEDGRPGGVVRYYESTPVAMADPDLHDQVIQKALREIDSWQKRYRAYEEFDCVFTSISHTKKKLVSA